jgi:hypothetical protein
LTDAVRFVILPAKSLILNINVPLPVKVYPVNQLLLSTFIGSFGFMIDTVTPLLVALILSYCNVANGAVLSIVLTTIGRVFDMPFASVN